MRLSSVEPEITSGAIARTEEWAPSREVEGLTATHAAIEGLFVFAVEPLEEGVFVLRRRSERRATLPSFTAVSSGEAGAGRP
jgi:hypothetical protein